MLDFSSYSNRTSKFKQNISTLNGILNREIEDLPEGFFVEKGKNIFSRLPELKTIQFFEDEDTFLVIYASEFEFFNFSGELLIENYDGENGVDGIVFYNSVLPHLKLVNVHKTNFRFINCYISEITIDKSEFKSLNIGFNSFSGAIYLQENSTLKNISVGGKSKVGGISLKYSKCDNISIKDSILSSYLELQYSKVSKIDIFNHSNVHYISIQRSSICSAVAISDHSVNGGITVRELSFIERLSITENSENGDIIATEFGDIFSIYVGNSIVRNVEVEKTSQVGIIKILNNCKCRNIEVEEGSMCSDIHLHTTTLNEIKLSNCKLSLYVFNCIISHVFVEKSLLNEIIWEAGSKGEMHIVSSNINYLPLTRMVLVRDSVFSFIDVGVYYLNLEELIVQGNLIFRGLQTFIASPETSNYATNFDFSAFEKSTYSEKIIELFERLVKQKNEDFNKRAKAICKTFPISELKISNSSLSKTEITGSRLDNFRILFRDSKISECFFSGTDFPVENLYIIPKDQGKALLSDRENYEQLVALYFQLKTIYDNQGDALAAGWYLSKATEFRHKTLLSKYQEMKSQRGWLNFYSDTSFDLFTFSLNKFSNNNGESWRRALIFILLSSFPIYCLYYASIFYFRSFSISGLSPFFGDYFEFLNITHRQEFLTTKEHLGFLSNLLDFLGRIIIAYGIYQLIASFRRHTRKIP